MSNEETVANRSDRCDYCSLPLPTDPLHAERDGVIYSFCSAACRGASDRSDHVFTEHHGFRHVDTGVDPLDRTQPDGMPRNAFVLLADEAGTRTEAIQVEIAWRALERGEPVIYVSFLEPSVSVLQQFSDADWNPLPYLEQGQLHLLDCFTARQGDQGNFGDRLQGWNRHLDQVADASRTVVQEPEELRQVQSTLQDCLDTLAMRERGLVVIDSLTELNTMVQPVKAYGFVKDVRADVCKARFVPIMAGGTVVGENTGFPHDLSYLVDGLVDIRLSSERLEDTLVKELRIRKMNGVPSIPKWIPYEVTEEGVVAIEIPDDNGDNQAS